MDIKESYVLLGLEQGATLEEVKIAYRKLAKQYHPDKTGADEFLAQMFRKIQTAYENLIPLLTSQSQEKEAHSTHQTYTQQKKEHSNPFLEEWIEDHHQLLAFLHKTKAQVTHIQNTKHKKNLSLGRVAQLVGLAFLILLLFNPFQTKRVPAQPPVVEQAKWQTASAVSLFKTPDRQTTALATIPKGQPVDSLGTTQYFFKVKVATPNGVQTGYILKDKLIQ